MQKHYREKTQQLMPIEEKSSRFGSLRTNVLKKNRILFKYQNKKKKIVKLSNYKYILIDGCDFNNLHNFIFYRTCTMHNINNITYRAYIIIQFY